MEAFSRVGSLLSVMDIAVLPPAFRCMTPGGHQIVGFFFSKRTPRLFISISFLKGGRRIMKVVFIHCSFHSWDMTVVVTFWVKLGSSSQDSQPGSEFLFSLNLLSLSLSQPPWMDSVPSLAMFLPDILFSNSCLLHCSMVLLIFSTFVEPQFLFLGPLFLQTLQGNYIFILCHTEQFRLAYPSQFRLYLCISKIILMSPATKGLILGHLLLSTDKVLFVCLT